jgi:hypothetical protein
VGRAALDVGAAPAALVPDHNFVLTALRHVRQRQTAQLPSIGDVFRSQLQNSDKDPVGPCSPSTDGAKSLGFDRVVLTLPVSSRALAVKKTLNHRGGSRRPMLNRANAPLKTKVKSLTDGLLARTNLRCRTTTLSWRKTK